MRLLRLAAAAVLLPACLEAPGASGGDILPAPVSLSAVLEDGAQVRLTWIDASEGETGFRVDVADSPLLGDADVDAWTMLPANAQAYTFESAPNTTSWFRVLALKGDRQSAPSNVASATTPNVPAAPARVEAVAGADDTDAVTITWDDVGDESGYVVERQLNGGGWKMIAALGPNTLSAREAGVPLNTACRFRVRGVNANGSGAWGTSPLTRTRDRSWDVQLTSGGDLSWNMGIALRFDGVAAVSCYDASSGRVALADAVSGSLHHVLIDPGFPASLGYGGSAVAATSSSVHVAAADGFTGKLYHLTSDMSGWRAEVVDEASADDRPILRKGPSDDLRVVYRKSGRLRYGVESGGSWITESIRDVDLVDYFDFRCAANGDAHVVYRRPAAGGGHELARALKRPGSGWTFETLPAAANPEMLSLALSADGAAFVAYNTNPGGELRLLSNRGGGWTDERVHASPRGSWGRYNSIEVGGSSGELHLVYSDNLHGALRYASRRPGEEWRLEPIDVDGDVGRHAALARDGEGVLFVAYGDASRGALKVAMSRLRPPSNLIASPASPSRVDLTWSSSPNSTEERVERSEDGGATWTTLSTGASGSYSDGAVAESKEYLYRVSALNRFGDGESSNVARAVPLWRRDVEVSRSTDYGARPSIAVGADGTEHVSHMDLANVNILYTVGRPDQSYATITADAGSHWSTQGALELSGGSVDIVAFQFSGGVRHTRIQGLVPTTTIVDSKALVPVNPCLKAAPDGTLHAIYSEQVGSGQGFRLAVRGPSGWTSERVYDGPLYQNQASYFAMDRAGRPHFALAYRQSSIPVPRNVLGYNRRLDNGWNSGEIVPPEPGGNCALVLDRDDWAHFLYVSLAGSVVYVNNRGNDWVVESFPREYPIRGLPALAVDRNTGRVHVAYGESHLLRYRRRDIGGEWVERVLDDSVQVGDVAMALDSAGRPHIAYQNLTLKKLRLTSGNP